MAKQKELFDPEAVSINIILEPSLRYVQDNDGTYQTEYIINYNDVRYLPLFEVDDERKLTGGGTVYKITMDDEAVAEGLSNIQISPIVDDSEWELAQELVVFVEANSEILQRQIARQEEQE